MTREQIETRLNEIDEQIEALERERDETLPQQDRAYVAYLKREADRGQPFPMTIRTFWKMTHDLATTAAALLGKRRYLADCLALSDGTGA